MPFGLVRYGVAPDHPDTKVSIGLSAKPVQRVQRSPRWRRLLCSRILLLQYVPFHTCQARRGLVQAVSWTRPVKISASGCD